MPFYSQIQNGNYLQTVRFQKAKEMIMVWNIPLPMFQGLQLRVRRTMHSWRKRHAPSCSEFENFTSICVVASSSCTQITSCLTTILGRKQGIPPLAAARLQYWELILTGYEYDIVFKLTKAHANTGGLTRLPISMCAITDEVDGMSLFNITQVHVLLVTAA